MRTKSKELSAAEFHIKGVLGRFMNCAPLPPLLTPHSSLFLDVFQENEIVLA